MQDGLGKVHANARVALDPVAGDGVDGDVLYRRHRDIHVAAVALARNTQREADLLQAEGVRVALYLFTVEEMHGDLHWIWPVLAVLRRVWGWGRYARLERPVRGRVGQFLFVTASVPLVDEEDRFERMQGDD